MSRQTLLLLICLATLPASSSAPDDNENNPYYNNFGSKYTLCPTHKKCIDGSFNFLCNISSSSVSKQCKRFMKIRDSRELRANMVNVHNGLRNKLAYDYRLANMNLVYWNVHLQRMAEKYLSLCRPVRDTCLMIGRDGYSLSQNILFVPSRNQEVLKEWEARAVRHWFMKLGSNAYTLDFLIKRNKKTSNVMQMIWPSMQFIGCSAATMFDGLFIVCYYYPNVTQDLRDEVTYLGKDETCVCPPERLMCSLLFTSLCGIDLNIYSGGSESTICNEVFIYFCIIIVGSFYSLPN